MTSAPKAYTALCAILLLLAMSCSGVCATAANNVYGAHTFIHDIMSPWHINTHLDWVRSMTGPGGYVKQMFYPIHPTTTGPTSSWVQFVQACYDRDLIPVIRLALWMEDGIWQKPPKDPDGSYRSMAAVLKAVVMGLPRDNDWPIYFEVLNEPNNSVEWSGNPNPLEYGQFLVEVSAAIRSIGDPRIKVMNGGLSPGGTYDNLAYTQQMCQNVPGFLTSFDAWATHPYTGLDPSINFHDGTTGGQSFTIDHYMRELQVIESFGRTGVKIIATEGGYTGGDPARRADLMMRAFRDYYSKWPEVLGICPWQFSNPFGFEEGVDWVYNDSTGTYPSHTAPVYEWTARLAKPWMTTGTVSGKVTESAFGTPVQSATVTLQPAGSTRQTDAQGNYIFEGLAPGSYSVSASKTGYTPAGPSAAPVAAATNTVCNFGLAGSSPVTLTGTIRDSITGEPLPNVQVVVSPGGQSMHTGSTGQYTFSGLTAASYSLTSNKAGYYNFSTSLGFVEPGATSVRDWWLGPGAAPPFGEMAIGSADFETPSGGGPASGWTGLDGQQHPETFSIDPTVRYNGIASQKINAAGSSMRAMWSISDYSAIVSNATYRVELWAKTQNPSGPLEVRVTFFSNDLVSYGSFLCKPDLSTTSGWTRLVGQGTTPVLPQNKGRLHVEIRANMSSGNVWVDRIWAGRDYTGQTPVASPSNFTALANPNQANFLLAWANGVTSGTGCTTIVYRTDRYPETPTDGTVLAHVAASAGAPSSTTHTGVTWNQRYYYAAFSHKGTGANPGIVDASMPVFASAKLQDITAPTSPTPVVDDGAFTTSSTQLHVTWSPASDPHSGIKGYRYAIGTTPGSTNVVPWSSLGDVTELTRTNLALVSGRTYYVSVRALNGANILGPIATSDGILASTAKPNIGSAKLLSDGSAVTLTQVVASSSTLQFSDRFFVQEPDRSAGIEVLLSPPSGLAAGDLLDVTGILASSGSVRRLTGAFVSSSAGASALRPLLISPENAAGGDFHYFAGPPAVGQRGAGGSKGPNNVGLLVSVWGRVVETGPGFYSIQAGTQTPVRILTDKLSAPSSMWDYVLVTGISTLADEGNCAALLPREPSDQVVLADSPLD